MVGRGRIYGNFYGDGREVAAETAPKPPPCEISYAGRIHQHPRFPSGDCVICGALCTEGCKHALAVGEYAPREG